MLDPIEVANQGQGRDRAERVGVWISGLAHTGLVLWAIVGGALFAARETPPPQMTDVTTISTQEFEELAARSRGAGPVGQADGNAPEQPQAPGDTTAPEGPDLALDAPDPDSNVATLPTPDAQSEDTPDLSDVENRTPPVDVATIAPESANPPSAEAAPDTPSREDAPQTETPDRPDTPADPVPPRSALALDASRPPPDRPEGLREAVLAARRAEEAEAAAAAERAEEQRLAALARENEQAQIEAEAAAAQERDRIAREAAAEAEAERAEQERREREQAEAERQQQEQERLAEALRREEEERRAEAERAEAARQEQERLDREQQEQERLAQERIEQERLAEEARRLETERLAEEARRAEEQRRVEQQRLQREAELREERDRQAAADAELARENALAEQLAEEERLQREAAMAEEATPSPFDGNAPEGTGEGGGSDVLTDALNEAGAAAIDPDQLDDALAHAMGTTRPSEIVRDSTVEIASLPMTEAEKDGFRNAVQSCWNQSTLSIEAAETRVVVGFTMNRSGLPDPDSFHIVGEPDAEPARLQAFEAARRAVMRCANGGYTLPAEKYNEWDDVEMTFTPEGVGRIE